MIGSREAAKLLLQFSSLVRRFSLLPVSWDPDADIVLLDDDVQGEKDRLLARLEAALGEISTAGDSDLPSTIELETLLTAGDLVEQLARCADDYLFYFEGLHDVHEDDEVSNDVRMASVTKEYESLAIADVAEKCEASAHQDLACAIKELSRSVSAIVHLPSDSFPAASSDDFERRRETGAAIEGQEVDVGQVSNAVKALYEHAVEVLLQASQRLNEGTH